MSGFLYGYARVSTDDQDMALQFAALERYGVERQMIYSEHASGKNMNRKRLSDVLKIMRSGDTLVIWKLDRLGRSLKDLIIMAESLSDQGIHLISLTDAINTSTPTGKLFFHFMGAMAEWERNMISERTKAGMAVKKAEGAKFGRAHTIRDNPKRIAAARKLLKEGKLIALNDDLLISARDLMEILNRADPRAKPISNPETVRRWWREGFPGLDEGEGQSDG